MNKLMIEWVNSRKDDGYCVCGCATKHNRASFYFKSGQFLWFANDDHRERWLARNLTNLEVLTLPLSKSSAP